MFYFSLRVFVCFILMDKYQFLFFISPFLSFPCFSSYFSLYVLFPCLHSVALSRFPGVFLSTSLSLHFVLSLCVSCVSLSPVCTLIVRHSISSFRIYVSVCIFSIYVHVSMSVFSHSTHLFFFLSFISASDVLGPYVYLSKSLFVNLCLFILTYVCFCMYF